MLRTTSLGVGSMVGDVSADVAIDAAGSAFVATPTSTVLQTPTPISGVFEVATNGRPQPRHTIGDRVATDLQGNVYVTGVFEGSIDFAGVTITAQHSGPHIFVAKLDAAGNVVWAQSLEPCAGVVDARSIAVAGNGRIAVSVRCLRRTADRRPSHRCIADRGNS